MISDVSGQPGGETVQPHRQNDPPVHIDRKIPLWGLLTALAIVAVQAVLMYIEQREQGVALRSIISTQSDTNKQLTEVAKELGNKNLKDVEHDLKLADLERRTAAIETALKVRP